MEIKNARVHWNLGYENTPDLEILVDAIPDNVDLRYEERSNLFFAELDGYVSFYYSNEKDHNGYAGHAFNLIMKDGRNVTLVGPWSSRPSVANSLGFAPSIDVSIFDNEDSWNRGHTAYGGHITLEAALSAIEQFLPDVSFEPADRHALGQINYEIKWDNRGHCPRCKGFKKYPWYNEDRICDRCHGTGETEVKA